MGCPNGEKEKFAEIPANGWVNFLKPLFDSIPNSLFTILYSPLTKLQLLPRRFHKLACKHEGVELFIVGVGYVVVRAFPPFFAIV
jgi:hypothetical protein